MDLMLLRSSTAQQAFIQWLFVQLCSFYHQSKLLDKTQSTTKVSTSSVQATISETSSSKIKNKDPSKSLENTLGQVWVGSIHKAICILASSAKVLQGKTEKITHRLTCMVEARAVNNLPMGLVVNRTMVTLDKSKKVPVAIVNTNSYNVWIHQPLLATDNVEVESFPWDYQSMMSRDGDNIKVSFCPAPSPEVQAEIMSASVMNSGENTKQDKQEQGKRSKFGPRPKFD